MSNEELRALITKMDAEAKHEAKVAKERDELKRDSWGFKRTAEALNRYRLQLEVILAANPPAAPSWTELTFETFSAINRQRCEHPSGFSHNLKSWSTSDWFLALLGELGEASNIAKKLNRVRDGIPGNKVSEAELRTKLRQELGDSFVYLDLLCQSLGFFIGEAAVEVFNAKSQELGCSILIEIPAQPPLRGGSGEREFDALGEADALLVDLGWNDFSKADSDLIADVLGSIYGDGFAAGRKAGQEGEG